EAVRGLRPFPDDVNGARLRSLVARFLAEPDLVTDSEILELGVENAVSMEIDVSSVRGRDAAVILLRMQLGDRAVRRTLVDLHLAANHSHAVLQLTAGSVEPVPQRDVDVLMGGVVRALPPGKDLGARHAHVDRDAIHLALSAVPMRRF